MKHAPIHTSNPHRADRAWLLLGGRIEPVRATGEKRYLHEHFAHPLRTNGRRNDVPAKLLSRLNQLLKMRAANDPEMESSLSKDVMGVGQIHSSGVPLTP